MPDLVAKAALLGAGALLVGVAGYVVLDFADRPRADVAWRVVAVAPEGPGQIRVTFEVDKPPAVQARCQLAAFTESGASAGRLDRVVVGSRADGARTTRLTVVVPTLKPATDAGVAQCVVLGGGG